MSPIRPEMRREYPPEWEQISHYVRFVRALGCCEGSPAFPDCRLPHGAVIDKKTRRPVPDQAAYERTPVAELKAAGLTRVVLTTAHLDHNPRNCELDNLRAWCQLCHLTYDAAARGLTLAQRVSEIEWAKQRAKPGTPEYIPARYACLGCGREFLYARHLCGDCGGTEFRYLGDPEGLAMRVSVQSQVIAARVYKVFKQKEMDLDE